MKGIPAFESARVMLDAAAHEGEWVTPGTLERLKGRKGAYILLVLLDKALPVGAGRQKAGHLSPGMYAYAGSAYGPGGLGARIRRHFRHDKKVHWHIDRLTLEASGLAAVIVENGDECQLVQALLETGGAEVALKGFGSTDCLICSSHLMRIA
nr:GIY-YIG nuclease family protein [uncultured Hyphomonas sp.]